MDIDRIETLAQQGESLSREFKISTNQLQPALETVCAYLNGKGGTVLFGVKNNGQIIGQDVSDHTRQEIASGIKKIEPTAQIEVHYIPTKNRKFVISFEAANGKHAPYAYNGRPYERLESSTVLMSQHRYEQLLVQRGQLNYKWEEQPCEEYDLNSLDHDEIRRTIIEGIGQNRIGAEVLNYSTEDVLEKLKLIKNGKLTNAAVVLFGKELGHQYNHCMIRLARFRGTDKLGDFIDNQRAYGNAFRILSAANDFALRHLPIASFFIEGKMQRIDQPAVPALALREALINSISHRDYTNRSASVALAIYDDRLEVWNNGQLPTQLKIEDLKKPHQSFPRNEIIATAFYLRGWVESWGTGTTRMNGFCQNNGTPEPQFSEYSSGFSVTFPFKERLYTSTQKPVHNKLEALSPRQKRILEILTAGKKMATADIARQLKKPLTQRSLQIDLRKLKEAGLVSMENKGPSSIWLIINDFT